jgi:hypothetical protein
MNIEDILGNGSGRPEHPDFWKLSDVCLKLDSGLDPSNPNEDEKQAQWEARIKEIGVDIDSLVYTATQRSFRVLNITNREQLIEKVGVATMLTSVWLDAFAAGAFYERQHGEEECPFDCDHCRDD